MSLKLMLPSVGLYMTDEKWGYVTAFSADCKLKSMCKSDQTLWVTYNIMLKKCFDCAGFKSIIGPKNLWTTNATDSTSTPSAIVATTYNHFRDKKRLHTTSRASIWSSGGTHIGIFGRTCKEYCFPRCPYGLQCTGKFNLKYIIMIVILHICFLNFMER